LLAYDATVAFQIQYCMTITGKFANVLTPFILNAVMF